jgi:hypothetical protein
MDTFDNGNAYSVSVNDRDTPILDGDVYCSRRCGCRCKKADYDRALEGAQAIVGLLGRGWSARVWENCGWHFSVNKGIATVTLDEDGLYDVLFDFTMSETNRVWMSTKGTDVRAAINELSAELEERIALLKRALMSVSVDPLEISTSADTLFIEVSQARAA